MTLSKARPRARCAARWRWWGLVALAPLVLLALAACDSSDDEERLAAQRFFRNYLMQADDTAAADVRIQGFVDTLPPDFPLPDGLTLLGSGFTDTQRTRELIVGWESDQSADELYEFYRQALDTEPWSIASQPRFRGIDFIQLHRCRQPRLRGRAAHRPGGRSGGRRAGRPRGPGRPLPMTAPRLPPAPTPSPPRSGDLPDQSI